MKERIDENHPWVTDDELLYFYRFKSELFNTITNIYIMLCLLAIVYRQTCDV